MEIYSLFATASAASDVSGSNPMLVGDCLYGSVQVDFTGADVAGTFKLQHSINGTSWYDIASASISVTSSAGGILSFSPANTGAKYVRFSWDYTSGTGNMTVTGMLKEAVYQ